MKHALIRLFQIVIVGCTTFQHAFAQIYFDDPSFQSLPLKYNTASISSAIIQPDKKVLVMGSFNFLNNAKTSFSLVRLNADGTHDETFHDGQYSGDILLRSDGKIINKHIYVSPNGDAVILLTLLNSNGEVESTFQTEIKTTTNIFLTNRSLAIQENNKVIVGSLIFQNGSYSGAIHRVNTDGTVDNSFNTGSLKINWLGPIAIQADGKILVSGLFDYAHGNDETLIRLNNDGSVDLTFDAPVSGYTAVSSIAFQHDGQILVSYSATYQDIIRLNVNGTQDNSFNSNIKGVYAMDLTDDGKIIASTHNSNNDQSQIFRLNSDGSTDASFVSGDGTTQGNISVLVSAGDKILAGGNFNNYNNRPCYGLIQLQANNGHIDATFHPKFETFGVLSQVEMDENEKLVVAGTFNCVGEDVSKRCIVRFNEDGSIDNTFNVGTSFGSEGSTSTKSVQVTSLIIQNDKKILVGGYFKSFNGNSVNGLIRLNPDGSNDQTFEYTGMTDNTIDAIAVQPDGNIVIAGGVTNSVYSSICKRLKPDGTIDITFNAGAGFNSNVRSMVMQPDGKILVIGYFTKFNTTAVNHIARLNSDGSLDNTFLATGTSGLVFSILIQSDGKILVGGNFSDFNGIGTRSLVRLNADGTIDPTFNANLPVGSSVQDIVLRSDEKILLSGDYMNQPYWLMNADGSKANYFFVLSANDGYMNNAILVTGTKMIASNGSRLVKFYSLISQTINFPSIANKLTNSTAFALEATASSGLPIFYTVVSGPATIYDNIVTLTGEQGQVTIRASQGGNYTYQNAIDVERTFIVDEAPPTFISQTINFPSIANKFTNSPAFTLKATASSGLPVSYTVISGPATLSGSTVMLTGNEGQVTIRATQPGNAIYATAIYVEQTFTVTLVTGVDTIEQNVKVYPNPASDILTLELPTSLHNVTSIQLFNTQGVAVHVPIKKSSSVYQIQINTLPRGLYILSLTGANLHTRKKIVVE